MIQGVYCVYRNKEVINVGVLSLELNKGLYMGIDFGTTNSVVSIYQYDQNEVHTLKIDGYTVFPSAVQFETDSVTGELNRIFGLEAKESAVIYPESTITSIKRRLESDEPIEITSNEERFSFLPEAIVAEILAHLKNQADEYIRDVLNIFGAFSGCVITVPANSTDKQKRKMKKAAVMAGFDEEKVYLRLEPAAAAIQYAISSQESKKVLVYDFGGGTFDACVLNIEHMEDLSEPNISIVSTYGDNYLGGNDLDQLMVDLIYENFLEQTHHSIDLYNLDAQDGLSVQEKKMAIIRMKQVANQVKEKLSMTHNAKVVLAPFIQTPIPVNIQFELSRDEFYMHKRQHQLDDPDYIFERMKNESVDSLVERTMESVKKCLINGHIEASDVDDIFLVGGSSAIPLVEQKIKEYFQQDPYRSKISPALSISQGAAHYCHQIMLPSTRGPKVYEKTIHSLGIEIAGRRYLEIIKRDMDIPEDGLVVEAPYTFETSHDDLTSMAIVVYEDLEPNQYQRKFVYEDSMRRLSGTTLRNIPSRPKGEEKIRVQFKLNQDNMLTVEAQSLDTEGISTSLTVDELYEK